MVLVGVVRVRRIARPEGMVVCERPVLLDTDCSARRASTRGFSRWFLPSGSICAIQVCPVARHVYNLLKVQSRTSTRAHGVEKMKCERE